MLLSGRVLDNVCSVNAFDYAETIRFTEGDAVSIYFQLVDLNKDLSNQGFNPPGRRYAPASGASLQVTLLHIDDAKRIVRAASQPYPTSDPSIWKLSLFATDVVRGTFDLNFALTEGTVLTRGVIHGAISAISQIQAYN